MIRPNKNNRLDTNYDFSWFPDFNVIVIHCHITKEKYYYPHSLKKIPL